MQEAIFSNKSIFFWWLEFYFSHKLHWGWRVCGEVQRGREGDCEAGSCNPGLKNLFLKCLLTTCLFYSWICWFVSCSGITEGLAAIAVGDQKLLPTASCVWSVKPPVTVSFSYTHSVFPSEDLLAVICDNNLSLYLGFVSSLTTAKRFDLPIPTQMDTYLPVLPPNSHTGSSSSQTLLFWAPADLVLGFLVGGQQKTVCFECVFWLFIQWPRWELDKVFCS